MNYKQLLIKATNREDSSCLQVCELKQLTWTICQIILNKSFCKISAHPTVTC